MNERISTIFFAFSSGETTDDLAERLREVKSTGFHSLIASYKTQGMEQAKFDDVYYTALDRLVKACQQEDVTFWLEDYAPFPTGSANGAYKEEENAALNKLYIDERHLDVNGPLNDAVVRIDSLQNVVYGKMMQRFTKVDPSGRQRIAVVACRMKENPQTAAAPYLEVETAVILDEYVENGFLKWNVPNGQWRIFVIYTTQESSGRAGFMNLLSLFLESGNAGRNGEKRCELDQTPALSLV